MFTIWLYLVVVDLNVCYDFCDSPKNTRRNGQLDDADVEVDGACYPTAVAVPTLYASDRFHRN